MNRSAFALFGLLLLAGCHETRKIPRPDPNWMPLGGTSGSVTLLDTARIGEEGTARLVWIRIDSVAPDSAGDPVIVPGARRESLHRVRCAELTVDDLQLGPVNNRGVPGPTDVLTVRSGIPFAQHPLGPRVFPSACNAIGIAGTLRAEENRKE
jgi:hypothetical protein